MRAVSINLFRIGVGIGVRRTSSLSQKLRLGLAFDVGRRPGFVVL
jgi:hypothetical protein